MNIHSIRVSPFYGKGGKAIPNQFEIHCNDGEIVFFQSYYTIIACKDFTSGKKKVYLDADWQNSMTTNKYRCIFLGENGAETAKKVKSGEYIVNNLNNKFHSITGA